MIATVGLTAGNIDDSNCGSDFMKIATVVISEGNIDESNPRYNCR